MKLRMPNGEVVTIMGVPRPRQPISDDEFAAHLERWIYLKVRKRKALLARMRTYPDEHWAKREYFPWALANLTIPTLPAEGVTLLPHSREEEDALNAYWEGWIQQCQLVWALHWKWPSLTRSERVEATALADLMAADFVLAQRLLDWMKAHLDDATAPDARDSEGGHP